MLRSGGLSASTDACHHDHTRLTEAGRCRGGKTLKLEYGNLLNPLQIFGQASRQENIGLIS